MWAIWAFVILILGNLHRQVIHSTETVGWSKAESAWYRLQEINPNIQCTTHTQQPLHHDNAVAILQGYDCVVDCSDNCFTRYVLNDACVLTRKPLIHGSAIGTEGQLTVKQNRDGDPGYRCLYPCPPTTTTAASSNPNKNCNGITSSPLSCGVPQPHQLLLGRSCSDACVLGPVPGLICILQAVEVLKLLTEQTTNCMKKNICSANPIGETE